LSSPIYCTTKDCPDRYKCKRSTEAPPNNQNGCDLWTECCKGRWKHYIHILSSKSIKYYPKLDRSNYIQNLEKTPENDNLDIGWAEGELRDGRPYWMECWCQDGLISVTFFFATEDLSGGDKQWWIEFFEEKEGLIDFTGGERFVGVNRFTDPSGHDMWSVNVLVGDEEQTFVSRTPGVHPYQYNEKR
jgi:hypothetical protein